ncbi:hypothetical protein HFO84_35695 [Rhizobium leguminosarum]|uniref:hypothetical protein n=1 Tax=Rhizobium leguminosarum TaxID=384 RepID=UPI001C98C54D|nr:hypothetical protein [Rhizobium leguminosarum]MBY5482617.1 hypothetical protein [Rhizobium leguminosarum]
MTNDLNLLPQGWRKMAQELLDKAQREFRGIEFTNISANPGGWLSIEFDKHSVGVEQNWRALKMAEGYSSMSWHVCSECGSHRGETHPGHVFAICEECRD